MPLATAPLPANPPQLARDKAAAARRAGLAPAPAPALLVPFTAAGPAAAAPLDAPGLTGQDSSSPASPSDSTGAIGPSDYVEMVNSMVAVYARGNLGIEGNPDPPTAAWNDPNDEMDLDAFLHRSGDTVFDPQIQWDPQSNRWYFAMVDDRPGSSQASLPTSVLAFGWSRTPDPRDLLNGWCQYFVEPDLSFGGTPGTYLVDFPRLGHNDTQLIVGANVFSSLSGISTDLAPTSDFQTASIFTAPKPPAGNESTCPSQPTVTFNGSPQSPLQTSSGQKAFSPVPTNGADGSPTGFVVAADDPSLTAGGTTAGQLSLWKVDASGALSGPTGITVAAYSVPPAAPQPGTHYTLDTMDARLTQAVAHSDPALGGEAIWTQHTVAGPSGPSIVHWYELSGASGAIVQQGSISDPAQYAFNAAISPTSSGDRAAIVYNAGSAAQLVRVRAQSRHAGMAAGAMSGQVTLGVSDAADTEFTCWQSATSTCRWGDYPGASPDPTDGNLVWGSSMLSGPSTTSPQWKTDNFSVMADQPPTAAFGYSPASPVAGGAVSFDGSGSTDGDGDTIRSYAWSFGDGATATGSGPTAQHAYATAGSYTVTLTVTDGAGLAGMVEKSVAVAAPAGSGGDPGGGGGSGASGGGASGGGAVAGGASAAAVGSAAPVLFLSTAFRRDASGAGPTVAGTIRVPRARIAAVLAHGLRVSLASDRGAPYRLSVLLDPRVVRRLGLRSSAPIGRASGLATAGGSAAIVVRIGRAVAAAVARRHPRSLQLTILVVLGDAGAGQVRLQSHVTLLA